MHVQPDKTANAAQYVSFRAEHDWTALCRRLVIEDLLLSRARNPACIQALCIKLGGTNWTKFRGFLFFLPSIFA
jgi:hypothetical protein